MLLKATLGHVQGWVNLAVALCPPASPGGRGTAPAVLPNRLREGARADRPRAGACFPRASLPQEAEMLYERFVKPLSEQFALLAWLAIMF